HVHRRLAERWSVGQTQPFRLRRRLGSDNFGVSTEYGGGASRRQTVEKLASAQGRHGSSSRATPEYGTSGGDYSITGYALSSSNASASVGPRVPPPPVIFGGLCALSLSLILTLNEVIGDRGRTHLQIFDSFGIEGPA